MYEITSAGSSAIDGLPASSLSVEVAKKNSIDLTDHSARFLNRTMVKESDLIVTMGEKHRETVGVIEPSALKYTFLMTEFDEESSGDIGDPIGLGLDVYEKTFEALEKCIKKMDLESFDGWKKTQD